jgi:hypothetical protein
MTDMIYIIHEAISGNDPRLDSRMEEFGEFWHYTVTRFPADQDIVYHWLNGTVVPERVAKAYKFTSAHDNEISVRKATSIWDDLADGSGDTEAEKIYYRLDPNDQANAVEFFKTVMKLHIENHADPSSRHTQTLKSMIDRLGSVTESQVLMYDYFDVGFPCTATRARRPNFEVKFN